MGGLVYAANNSVQGAREKRRGIDGDARPNPIEANSGSCCVEKNADELRDRPA